MLVVVKSILFFTIASRLVGAFNPEEADKKFVPCGLYGFRCLDKKRAQICDEMYADSEGSSPKPRVFECAEGLICDEEKTEFCAPMETSYINSTTEKQIGQKKRRSKQHRRAFRGYQKDIFDEMEQVTSTKAANNDDDDDDEPTEKPDVDPWNGSPPINCGAHGFYPGLTSIFINKF